MLRFVNEFCGKPFSLDANCFSLTTFVPNIQMDGPLETIETVLWCVIDPHFVIK
jgi:hypothetical protein